MKNESNASSPAMKPMKFAPKIVPRKVAKAVIPKSEPVDSKNDVIDKELLSKLSSVKNEGPGRRMPNNDRKFAFAMGSDSTKARSFGKPRLGYDGDVYNASCSKKEKEYIEPWDYSHSYYPVTLPLRRPYMGDPETIDEEEFGQNSTSTTFDESLIDPTDELELLERSDEAQMLLFQFPKHFSVPKVSAGDAKGKSVLREEDYTEIKEHNARKGCSLKELPAGLMGKLLVYRSGAVKLKLGESLFDVSPGSDCGFAQEVTAIRTDMKQCCVLGELSKRAIVTPDVDSLFDSMEHTGHS